VLVLQATNTGVRRPGYNMLMSIVHVKTLVIVIVIIVTYFSLMPNST